MKTPGIWMAGSCVGILLAIGLCGRSFKSDGGGFAVAGLVVLFVSGAVFLTSLVTLIVQAIQRRRR